MRSSPTTSSANTFTAGDDPVRPQDFISVYTNVMPVEAADGRNGDAEDATADVDEG